MEGNEVIARAIERQPDIKCFIHTGSIDYVPSEDLVSMGIDLDSIIHKPILNMADICQMIEKKIKKN